MHLRHVVRHTTCRTLTVHVPEGNMHLRHVHDSTCRTLTVHVPEGNMHLRHVHDYPGHMFPKGTCAIRTKGPDRDLWSCSGHVCMWKSVHTRRLRTGTLFVDTYVCGTQAAQIGTHRFVLHKDKANPPYKTRKLIFSEQGFMIKKHFECNLSIKCRHINLEMINMIGKICTT